MRLNGGTVEFSNNALKAKSSFGDGSAGWTADFQSDSTLRWGTGNTTNITQIRIGDGVTATFDTGANSVALVSAFSLGTLGTGAVTKAGSGILTMTAANTYTGGTTVSAGTLVTGHTGALGAGNVSVTAGTLQIGDGTTYTVTLGSGADLVVASGATLKIDSATSAIVLTGAGGFTLGSGAIIDLGGVFDGLGSTTTYNLITGGTGAKTAGASVTGYDTNVFGSVTFDNNGVLTFTATAVPEPSTYGLLGAGALAAFALARRRKKRGA